MANFSGQVVFITGASSGIGAALAREMARQGAKLVLAARRTDRLEALATELRQMGREALVVACDVTQEVAPAIQAALAQFGRIDVVVANAGYSVAGRVEELSLEDYQRQFETNVYGVLRTVYASLEALKKSRGSLVLIGSVAGYISLPGSSAYTMSKFAIHALASSLTAELRPYGVSVTLIAPGFVESEIREVDNWGKRQAGARDPLPAWIKMPTDVAARQIARAVAARCPEQVITFHGKVVVFLKRFFPGVITLMVKKGLRGRSGQSRV